MVDMHIDPSYEWAYIAITALSGEELPEIDIATARQVLGEFNAVAAKMAALSGGVNLAGVNVGSALTGPTERAFQLASQDLMKGVPELIATLNNMSAEGLNFTLDAEHTVYVVYLAMFMTVFDIFLALFFGAGYLVPLHLSAGGLTRKGLIQTFKLRWLDNPFDDFAKIVPKAIARKLPNPPGKVPKGPKTPPVDKTPPIEKPPVRVPEGDLPPVTKPKTEVPPLKPTPKGDTPPAPPVRPPLTKGQIATRAAWEITEESIDEAVEEFVQDGIGYGLQAAEGNRKSVDGKQWGMAAAGGAFIGGVASVWGEALKKLLPNFSKTMTGRALNGAIGELLGELGFTGIVGGSMSIWGTVTSSMLASYGVDIAHKYGPGPIPGAPPHVNAQQQAINDYLGGLSDLLRSEGHASEASVIDALATDFNSFLTGGQSQGPPLGALPGMQGGAAGAGAVVGGLGGDAGGVPGAGSIGTPDTVSPPGAANGSGTIGTPDTAPAPGAASGSGTVGTPDTAGIPGAANGGATVGSPDTAGAPGAGTVGAPDTVGTPGNTGSESSAGSSPPPAAPGATPSTEAPAAGATNPPPAAGATNPPPAAAVPGSSVPGSAPPATDLGQSTPNPVSAAPGTTAPPPTADGGLPGFETAPGTSDQSSTPPAGTNTTTPATGGTGTTSPTGTPSTTTGTTGTTSPATGSTPATSTTGQPQAGTSTPAPAAPVKSGLNTETGLTLGTTPAAATPTEAAIADAPPAYESPFDAADRLDGAPPSFAADVAPPTYGQAVGQETEQTTAESDQDSDRPATVSPDTTSPATDEAGKADTRPPAAPLRTGTTPATPPPKADAKPKAAPAATDVAPTTTEVAPEAPTDTRQVGAVDGPKKTMPAWAASPTTLTGKGREFAVATPVHRPVVRDFAVEIPGPQELNLPDPDTDPDSDYVAQDDPDRFTATENDQRTRGNVAVAEQGFVPGMHMSHEDTRRWAGLGSADPSWPALPGARPEAAFDLVYGWLRGVNPYRADDAEFLLNCLLTSIAVDMTLQERLENPSAVADDVYFQAPPSALATVGDLLNYSRRQMRDVADYDAVRSLMMSAPVGARGIVVVTETDGAVSHSFNVVRDADGVAFLDGQTGKWATGPESPARLRFLPTTDGIPQSGPESPTGLDDLLGAFGLEVELHEFVVTNLSTSRRPKKGALSLNTGPGREELHYNDVIAKGPGVEIKLDKSIPFFISEVVAKPGASVPGEVRPDGDASTLTRRVVDVIRHFRAMQPNEVRNFAEVIAGLDGFEAVGKGLNLTIRRRDAAELEQLDLRPQGWTGLYTQYNLGVSLPSLRSELARDLADGPKDAILNGLLGDGLRIGDEFGARQSEFGSRAGPLDAEIMSGVLALVYPHVVAAKVADLLNEDWPPGRPPVLAKNLLIDASRMTHRAIRADLPVSVRDFLKKNAPAVRSAFSRTVRDMLVATLGEARVSAFFAAQGLLDTDGQPNLFQPGERGNPLNDYLNNLLFDGVDERGEPVPYVDQNQAVGITTQFDETDRKGGLSYSQVVLEKRAVDDSVDEDEIVRSSERMMSRQAERTSPKLPRADADRLLGANRDAVDAATEANSDLRSELVAWEREISESATDGLDTAGWVARARSADTNLEAATRLLAEAELAMAYATELRAEMDRAGDLADLLPQARAIEDAAAEQFQRAAGNHRVAAADLAAARQHRVFAPVDGTGLRQIADRNRQIGDAQRAGVAGIDEVKLLAAAARGNALEIAERLAEAERTETIPPSQVEAIRDLHHVAGRQTSRARVDHLHEVLRLVGAAWTAGADRDDVGSALREVADLNEENEQATDQLRAAFDSAAGDAASNLDHVGGALPIVGVLGSRALPPGPMRDAVARQVDAVRDNFREAAGKLIGVLASPRGTDVAPTTREMGNRSVQTLNAMTADAIEDWRTRWEGRQDSRGRDLPEDLVRQAERIVKLADSNYETANVNRRAAIKYADSVAGRPLTDAVRQAAERARDAAVALEEAAQNHVDQANENRRIAQSAPDDVWSGRAPAPATAATASSQSQPAGGEVLRGSQRQPVAFTFLPESKALPALRAGANTNVQPVDAPGHLGHDFAIGLGVDPSTYPVHGTTLTTDQPPVRLAASTLDGREATGPKVVTFSDDSGRIRAVVYPAPGESGTTGRQVAWKAKMAWGRAWPAIVQLGSTDGRRATMSEATTPDRPLPVTDDQIVTRLTSTPSFETMVGTTAGKPIVLLLPDDFDLTRAREIARTVYQDLRRRGYFRSVHVLVGSRALPGGGLSRPKWSGVVTRPPLHPTEARSHPLHDREGKPAAISLPARPGDAENNVRFVQTMASGGPTTYESEATADMPSRVLNVRNPDRLPEVLVISHGNAMEPAYGLGHDTVPDSGETLPQILHVKGHLKHFPPGQFGAITLVSRSLDSEPWPMGMAANIRRGLQAVGDDRPVKAPSEDVHLTGDGRLTVGQGGGTSTRIPPVDLDNLKLDDVVTVPLRNSRGEHVGRGFPSRPGDTRIMTEFTATVDADRLGSYHRLDSASDSASTVEPTGITDTPGPVGVLDAHHDADGFAVELASGEVVKLNAEQFGRLAAQDEAIQRARVDSSSKIVVYACDISQAETDELHAFLYGDGPGQTFAFTGPMYTNPGAADGVHLATDGRRIVRAGRIPRGARPAPTGRVPAAPARAAADGWTARRPPSVPPPAGLLADRGHGTAGPGRGGSSAGRLAVGNEGQPRRSLGGLLPSRPGSTSSVVDSGRIGAALMEMGALMSGPAAPQDEQRNPLTRVNSGFKVLERDLADVVEASVGQGEHLSEVFDMVLDLNFVKEPTDAKVMRLWVRKERSKVMRAVRNLRRALDDVRALEDRRVAGRFVTENQRTAALVDLARKLEDFSKAAEHSAKMLSRLIVTEAFTSVIATQDNKVQKVVGKAMEIASNALNAAAPFLLPTGMTVAAPMVELATKATTESAMKLFREWQESVYRKEHTFGEVLYKHDADPLTIAKAIIGQQKRAVELLVGVAGIGGAYVPFWGVFASAAKAVISGYLDERVKIAEKAAQKAEIVSASKTEKATKTHEVFERMWEGFHTSLKEKVGDGTLAVQIYKLIEQEEDLPGLVNVGSDIAVKTLLGMLLVLIPPKPATPITGDMLRDALMAAVGKHKEGWTAPSPTRGSSLSEQDLEQLQNDLRGGGFDVRTNEGRPVIRSSKKDHDDDRAYVAVEYNGAAVWGYLFRETSQFEPHRPGDFMQIGVDDLFTVTEHGWEKRKKSDKEFRETVEGSWYQPFDDAFHYLFVRADGTWDWVHAFTPTGGINSDEQNVHMVMQDHQDWLKPFSWHAPEVAAVDFSEKSSTLVPGIWALWQTAYKAADILVDDHSTPGGTWLRTTLHIEAGGNMPIRDRVRDKAQGVRSRMWHLVRDAPAGTADDGVAAVADKSTAAQAAGDRRAAAVRAKLEEFIPAAIEQIRTERRLLDDEVPTLPDGFFATHSRGALDTVMTLEGDQKKRRRRTYMEIRRAPVSRSSSGSPPPQLSSGSLHRHRPVDFNDPVTQWRVALYAGSRYDETVYCVAAVVQIRDMAINGAAIGQEPGNSVDDSQIGVGLWSGWGRPQSWPSVRDWEVVHELVAAQPGRFAAVLMNRSGGAADLHGVGHAFAAVNRGGQVQWIDPRTRDDGHEVMDIAELLHRADTDPTMTNDLSVRVYEADGTEVTPRTGGELHADTVAPLLLAHRGYGMAGPDRGGSSPGRLAVGHEGQPRRSLGGLLPSQPGEHGWTTRPGGGWPPSPTRSMTWGPP